MSTQPSKNPNQDILSLTELSIMIKHGDLSHINGKVLVDLDNINRQDFNTLLEIVRHKTFGHDLLRRFATSESSDSTESIIEALRIHNHNGEFDRTLTILDNKDPHDNPEFLLEKSRALAFLGRHQDVVGLLTVDRISKVNTLATQGVLYQVLGHSRMELGQIEDARISLMRGLEISQTIGNREGEISCHMFMSKYYSFKRDPILSLQSLQKTLKLLKEVHNYRWLLGYYRTLSHHQFFSGDSNCFKSSIIAALLARAMNDELYYAKSFLEFMVMQRKFRVDFFADDTFSKDILTSKVIKTNSELMMWKELAETGQCTSTQQPSNIRAFANSILDLEPLNEELGISNFRSAMDTRWLIDTNDGIIIDLDSATYDFLAPDSPLLKLVLLLNASAEPASMPDVFQSIWKQPWKAETHENTLKVTIGRISRMSPSIKIRRKRKTLFLENKGLVL